MLRLATRATIVRRTRPAFSRKCSSNGHEAKWGELNRSALELWSKEKYPETLAAFENICMQKEAVYGAKAVETVPELQSLAVLSHMSGRLEKALKCNEQICEIIDTNPDAAPSFKAAILNDMGRVVEDQGRKDEAAVLYSRAAAVFNVPIPLPGLSASVATLPHATLLRGWREHGNLFYEKSAATSAAAPTADLPDGMLDVVPGILANAGMLYENAGKFDLADPLHRRVVLLEMSVLRWDHPHQMNSLHVHDFASLRAHGDYTPLVAEQMRNLGPDHPALVASFYFMAWYSLSSKNLDTAEHYAKRALAVCMREYGPEGVPTATSYHMLGVISSLRNDYVEAVRYLTKTLDIRTRVYGTSHYRIIPHTALIQYELGQTYLMSNDAIQAHELLKQSHMAMQAEIGEDHPLSIRVGSLFESCRKVANDIIKRQGLEGLLRNVASEASQAAKAAKPSGSLPS